jgi:hypothetical protein
VKPFQSNGIAEFVEKVAQRGNGNNHDDQAA